MATTNAAADATRSITGDDGAQLVRTALEQYQKTLERREKSEPNAQIRAIISADIRRVIELKNEATK